MPLPLLAVAAGFWNALPEETKNALRSSVTDVGVSAVCGKKGLEEWAEEFTERIDEYKDNAVENEGLTYVGGELKFFEEKNAKNKLEANKIVVSFELYFQDSEKSWKKMADSAKLGKLFFTPEALTTIQNESEVKFEII